jgi:hypothetical protein
MSTNATANLANGLTLFLTAAGVDLLLRREGKQYRARADYATLQTVLDDQAAIVEFTDDDEVVNVTLDDEFFELKLQPKGHYFSFLEQMPPKAEAVSIAEARKLFRAAQRSKAKAK